MLQISLGQAGFTPRGGVVPTRATLPVPPTLPPIVQEPAVAPAPIIVQPQPIVIPSTLPTAEAAKGFFDRHKCTLIAIAFGVGGLFIGSRL